jgi:hypothetical protein
MHHGLSHYISVYPTMVAQYILPNLNTSNISFIGPAIQPTVHLVIFQYHMSIHPPVPHSIHPGVIINTSFNTSCQENNTCNTSFNSLQHIMLFFNTSDVLDDVLDASISNTSFNTSQYICLIYMYIPIHPSCIRMCWMLIHSIHPSIHPPRFANV